MVEQMAKWREETTILDYARTYLTVLPSRVTPMMKGRPSPCQMTNFCEDMRALKSL